MKRLLLAAVIVSRLHAAVYFTIRSGNWNDNGAGTTPWATVSCASPTQSLSTPGSGDTITICNGHTLTIPSGYTATIGASPNDDVSTPAIQTASTSGTGILVNNGTLVYKGTVAPANAAWVGGAGSIFTCNSASASSPTTTHYSWLTGASGGTNTSSNLTLNGTSNSHVTWNKAASSGNCGGFGNQAGVNNNGGGRMTTTYTDFSDVGGYDGTTNFYFLIARFNSSQTLSLGGTCTRCGMIDFPNAISATANINFVNWSTYSGTDQNGWDFFAELDSTAATSGTRTITNSYMTGVFVVSGNNSGQWVFTNSILGGSTASPSSNTPATRFSCTTSTTGTVTMTDVLIFNAVNVDSSPANIPCIGTFTRLWVLREPPAAANNAHFIQQQNCAAGTNTFSGVLFELSPTNTSNIGEGDFLQPGGASGSCTVNQSTSITNVLALPASGSSIRPGTVINMSSPAAATPKRLISVSKVTYPDDGIGSPTHGGACYWENITQMDSMYTVCQNSIVWSGSSAGMLLTNCASCGSAVNYAIHGADYNWAWNASGSIYSTTSINYSTPGPPGTHDQSGSPGFVDRSRSFLKWCQTIDASLTTWQGCIAKMDPQSASYNSRFNIADGYNWVRQGFAPRNLTTATAASDGTYVGAVPPVAILSAAVSAQ